MEKKRLWMVLGLILACPLALLGLLYAWSPGHPDPFLDDNGQILTGSISEKGFVEIYGMQQAPLKGFYTFEESAHFPISEEPGKTASLVQGVCAILQGPAQSAAFTMLVPDERRDRANGIAEMAFPLAGVAAPALA
jgi:MFS family permease